MAFSFESNARKNRTAAPIVRPLPEQQPRCHEKTCRKQFTSSDNAGHRFGMHRMHEIDQHCGDRNDTVTHKAGAQKKNQEPIHGMQQ